MNITREYIEQLNTIEPYCFENDREEQWFNIGLQYGLEVADANPKSPWIAAEDKLPKIGQAVFIRTSKSTYGVSWIDYDLDWQGGVAYSPLIVTHWMPIPKLPNDFLI